MRQTEEPDESKAPQIADGSGRESKGKEIGEPAGLTYLGNVAKGQSRAC
jgi:hypothetical protein